MAVKKKEEKKEEKEEEKEEQKEEQKEEKKESKKEESTPAWATTIINLLQGLAPTIPTDKPTDIPVPEKPKPEPEPEPIIKKNWIQKLWDGN